MKTFDIIAGGIAGTTAFTLFSYLLSKKTGKNFKEPELIGKMINRSVDDLNAKQSQFAGWLSHYLIGISFAGAYKELVDKTGMKPSVTNGIITGAISGFPAALTWHTSLSLHPAPPRKKSLDYYLQLCAGHALFGAACFFVFGLSKKANNKKQILLTEEPLNANESKLTRFATAGS